MSSAPGGRGLAAIFVAGLALGLLAGPARPDFASELQEALKAKLEGKPGEALDNLMACGHVGHHVGCVERIAEAYALTQIGFYDFVAAMAWYRRAAQRGDTSAMRGYAIHYCMYEDPARAPYDPGLTEVMAWNLVAARRAENDVAKLSDHCFEVDVAANSYRPKFGYSRAEIEAAADRIEQYLAAGGATPP